MTVRVRYKIQAYVSSTTAEEKDLGNQSWEIVTDTIGEGGGRKMTLAASTTDAVVELGNLAVAKLLVIRTSATDPTMTPNAITFKRGTTGGEAIVVQPLGDAKEGHLLLSTDSLTALFATNAGTASMDLTIIAVGD